MWDDFWSLWGDPSSRDISLNNISEWEIKKMVVRGEATIEDVGNLKGIFRLRDGRWTMLRGGWSETWPTKEQAQEPPATPNDRIGIFLDTITRCYTDPRLRKAVTDSIKGQVTYWEQDPVACVEPRFQAPAKLVLSRRRTLEAAGLYARGTGKRVCALNFASSVTPGGGVTRGATAQEESICRISTLYPALVDMKTAVPFYQEHQRRIQNRTMGRENSDDCIFTPGVVCFKEDDFNCALLLEPAWFTVDMITCSAPDQRYDQNGNSYRPTPEALLDRFTHRIERIFQIAALHKADVLILGAFGCGAFRNDPRIVAKAFEAVVSKYRTSFETIEFAVYCRDESSENLRAFRDMVQSLTGADS